MSRFIAGTAVLLFVVGGLLGLFVWRPSSRAAFEQRTETLLKRTEGGFRAIAGSVVEDVVGYGVDSAASAGTVPPADPGSSYFSSCLVPSETRLAYPDFETSRAAEIQ